MKCLTSGITATAFPPLRGSKPAHVPGVRRQGHTVSDFKHHKYFTPDKVKNAYLFPNVCFACRKSFRRPISEEPRKCPDCGGQTVRLSRKFKAPKKDDVNAWLIVKFVVDSGLVYQSIHLEGGYLAEYPKTMKEAEIFVAKYGKNKA